MLDQIGFVYDKKETTCEDSFELENDLIEQFKSEEIELSNKIKEGAECKA